MSRLIPPDMAPREFRRTSALLLVMMLLGVVPIAMGCAPGFG